ncbi:MAG TPA: hypothetical protein VGL47_15005 [Amycolatopsis sp.]|uniref:hypothetical protein n=1 Tax=Amycolatopsis sp. TaxID=37632 RepID=UPI002F404283
MTDLDDLRSALRARESLAPDPDAVLAVATRRIRRRRTTGVAAVALAVAAIGAGGVVLLDRDTATAPPAVTLGSASASPEQVPPAAPAVSLEDGSWTLLFWAVQPHFASLHYAQDHRYGFEIEVRDGTAPGSALAAKPTTAGQLADPRSVTWQDGPGRWIRVRTTKPVTAAEMLALLTKIRGTPPVIASPLKSVRVPQGQKVTTFTSEPETNTLVLCPDPEKAGAPLDNRCLALTVSLTSSNAASPPSPEDPLPAYHQRAIGAYTVEIASSHANEPAALALLDSVQLAR